MIALYIIAAVVLLFTILMASKTGINIRYDGEMHIKITYLFFRINLLKPKKEKPIKTRKKTKDPVKKAPQKTGTGQKEKHSGKWENARSVIAAMKKPLRILLKKTTVSDLDVRITVAQSDAAATAVKYGQICIGAHTVLALVRNMFDVKVKRMDIGCDFFAESTVCDIKLKIKTRMVTLITILISFFINMIKIKQKGMGIKNERSSNSGNAGDINGKTAGHDRCKYDNRGRNQAG
ncbi:MAG: hypothetical protein FWG69_04975 [Oscillospiraceae bacterium]|nr:hypothetical protein [Oscillospiraceae bacterium]